MTKKANNLHHSISLEWKYPNLAKPECDGGYCYLFQRRISCYFSIYFMKLGLSPSQATLVDFIFGCLAALALVFQYYLLAVIFIWFFGIWSCVDGEIARLSDKCSLFGDFFDTMTDRVIEVSVIIAFYWSIYAVDSQVDKYLSLAFIVYLGGVYLLAVSSEKYRSMGRGNYPKKKMETLFSWVSAGSDIRLLWLSIAIFVFWMTENQKIITIQIGALSVIFFINFIVRMFKINNLLSLNTTSPLQVITSAINPIKNDLKIMKIAQVNLIND